MVIRARGINLFKTLGPSAQNVHPVDTRIATDKESVALNAHSGANNKNNNNKNNKNLDENNSCSDWIGTAKKYLNLKCLDLWLVPKIKNLVSKDHFLKLLRNYFWSYWLNLSDIWDDQFFKLLRFSWDYFVLRNNGVLKLLVESKRDLSWWFLKPAQIELRLILCSEPWVFCSYWLNLSRIWDDQFFKLLRLSWD